MNLNIGRSNSSKVKFFVQRHLNGDSKGIIVEYGKSLSVGENVHILMQSIDSSLLRQGYEAVLEVVENVLFE